MQPLERAVAIFCIACICAELTTQLAGSTWARRCIKAVAGLYILVVFARTVPQAHVQLRAFLVPVQEPVSIASPETAILAQTRAQLEQTLAEQWYTKTGREASVAVMLKETDSVVAICSAPNDAPGKLYRGRTAAGRCLFAGKASAAAETDPDRCSGGGNTMKPELSELRKWLQTLLKKQNRARLALVLGCIAMALILLSELFPAKAPAAPQAVSPEEGTYKTQLEQQLTELIEQVQGAGKTTVMLTLESGEETVYALDTLSGQTQTQQTHVLLDDGTALEQTVYLPTICGVAVVCEGGGDVRVASRITELVGALLDVPSNRVCVEQRCTRN